MKSPPNSPTRRGRPLKSHKAAEAEAQLVLAVALALKLHRFGALEGMGLTEAAALRFVRKRRRGATAALVGADARNLIFPAQSRTERALQLVLQGMPAAVAARTFGIDRRNLVRALPKARREAAREAQRQLEFAARTTVETLTWGDQ